MALTVRMPVLAGLVFLPSLAVGQPASSFEVASLKPVQLPRNTFAFGNSPTHSVVHISGNRVTALASLTGLVMAAYQLKDFQISGAPGWTDSRGRDQLYDLAAKTEGDATPTMDQVRPMLQTLLIARFQLKVHRETKDFPVYNLVVDKNGSKLKASAPDTQPADRFIPSRGGVWRFECANLSIADLLPRVARELDRPLLDKTNLKGGYDFTLEYTHETAAPGSPDADRSIFTALQAQLGLKLVAAKEPTEILVIDHAEKPAEN